MTNPDKNSRLYLATGATKGANRLYLRHALAGLQPQLHSAEIQVVGFPHMVPHQAELPGGAPRTVPQLATLYDFPTEYDGSGQTIGLLFPAIGGFDPTTVAIYFDALGLSVPEFKIITLEGATNNPSSYETLRNVLVKLGMAEVGPPVLSVPHTSIATEAQADSVSFHSPTPQDMYTLEAILDVEIIGAVAPRARLLIYFSPPSAQGIHDMIVRAVDDGVDILSCTWGWPENNEKEEAWVPTVDKALAYAVSKNVTILACSGDYGSSGGPGEKNNTELAVQYPASSVWVVSCGGTTFISSPAQSQEIVWNETIAGTQMASGGGFSVLFKRPEWQCTDVPSSQRGVPDIAANAAASSGVWLYIGNPSPAPQDLGVNGVSFGTSAAAPLMAGLVALINQALGCRAGYLNSFLYEPGVRSAIVQIVQGNNVISKDTTEYEATPGWNACTGLGRVNGKALLAALQQALSAKP